jgi:dTDP-4-dehydrorhamnose 3,5-epimerase
MTFEEAPLDGAWIIGLERHVDERGFFARTFCEREFAEHGIPTRFPQGNVSSNRRARTLRGMHFNVAPYGEAKLVSCLRGAIYDVIVDLRTGSRTRFEWFGIELTADDGQALFVPAGFAHGFVTLADDTDVHYRMGDFFRSEAAAGFRWDDPAIDIRWPVVPEVMATRDATYPDLDPDRVLA